MRGHGSRAHAVEAAHAQAGLRSTDRSLAAGMLEGDRDSIGSLYDLYAPVMIAVAVKALGGRHREAQDLVHDVFLEAWLHAGDYDPERGSLRSWLLLRLRSRALDRLGTAEATRTRSLDEGDPAVAASTLAPRIERADRIGLQEAVGRLDASVRDVLQLTYFRGLTAPEIAGQLGLPIGTVRSRLARGLRELRVVLEPGEHPGDRGRADER
jgi:RNA polymerase sigma-70 factor (ECF subfamily)